MGERRPTTLPWRRTAALAIAAITMSAGFLTPAEAAPKPTVTFRTSAVKPTTGSTVKLSGKVSHRSVGAKVRIQQKVGKKPWRTIRTVKVRKTKWFSARVVAQTSTVRFRAVVPKSKKFRWSRSRVIKLTPRSATGSVARDRILADTNAYRVSKGKSPLKPMAGLTRVAQKWAKQLHDSGEFKHNPNVGSQIPKGWKRWGENIAGGYSYTSVVNAWANSSGHRANLLGDFTHLGVGFVKGNKGYRTYAVQVFGKY